MGGDHVDNILDPNNPKSQKYAGYNTAKDNTGNLITKVEYYDSNELARRLTFSYNNINQLDSEEVEYYLPDASNPTYTKTDYNYTSNTCFFYIRVDWYRK